MATPETPKPIFQVGKPPPLQPKKIQALFEKAQQRNKQAAAPALLG